MKNLLKLSLLFLFPLLLTGCFDTDEDVSPSVPTVDYILKIKADVNFANALYDCMLNASDFEYKVKYSLISNTSDQQYNAEWTRQWDYQIDHELTAKNVKVGSYTSKLEISFDGKTTTINGGSFEITEGTSNREFNLTTFNCP